ncbi:MAG TPA: glycoside hydrolase family 32 protein [Blastocatellia bacterium]|nr:glycoside hydrolase family 32 protein [Blastocatellia bacterium]
MSLLLFACTLHAQPRNDYYNEPYRPQFHFTPEKNWMNDPNGLVYYKGEYHLFYQYNPFGNSWGHMSWGHAISTDLVHWKHLPVALAEENGVMMFSGSAVVDWNNSSGLCKSSNLKEKSCLIAIYTGHIEGKNQSQHIAVSNDRGRTWTKFAGNPVLDIGYKDFRDPKVFWHEATKQWVMVVSLSKEQKVNFYGSPNLKNWTLLSEFGNAGVADKNVLWECPDLFELPVEGQAGKKRWVLIVNINPGGVAGGSGGQYFIGTFDGKTFTNDNPADTKLFVDHGKDFYAAVSFSDIPKRDGRRIIIGWMSNWQYAGKEPTMLFRTAQSIPRELKLKQTNAGLRLVQRPIAELRTLRGAVITKRNLDLSQAHAITSGEAMEINGEFAVGKDSIATIRLQAGNSETLIGFDAATSKMFIDRTKSGNVDFDRNFAGRHEVSLQPQQGKIKLHIFVDRSSVEVFGNDGEAALTDRIFPASNLQQVKLQGANSKCLSFNVWQLKSVWRQ